MGEFFFPLSALQDYLSHQPVDSDYLKVHYVDYAESRNHCTFVSLA